MTTTPDALTLEPAARADVGPGHSPLSRSRSIGSWLLIAAGGALAGVVGAALMLVVMGLLRWTFGISPLPEAVPDRIAPALSIPDFFALFADYGGYNGLKRFGIWTGIRAIVGAGVVLGIIYAVLTEFSRTRRPHLVRFGVPRASWLFIGIALLVVWIASVGFLWPVLTANYRGLSPAAARPVSIIGLLVTYLSFGLCLIGLYRFLTGGAPRIMPPGQGAVEAGDAGIRPRLAMPRRAILAGGVGAALGLTAYGMVRFYEQLATFSYDGLRPRGARLDPITPVEKFYVVTKNVVDPDIAKPVWRLEVTGHVDEEHTYDLEELSALPQVDQETTLMCISNRVGDILISNAVWTGVPMRTLLEAAGVRDGAVEVRLHGADAYVDTFDIENALDPTTLIAFRMNGVELPERHGYPARVVVPGLYGEKNVKWLTGIEVTERPTEGFYEQQGWGPNFVVPTRSLFYVPELRNAFSVGETIDLRGVAFAGNRGISSVEVSLDGGATWLPAEIDYEGTDLTWSLWSYDWRPSQPGEYTLVVRCTDGTGEPQSTENRGIISEGATGLHTNKATIVA